MNLDEQDLRHLRQSFRVAEGARQLGNHPFGAVLAHPQGRFYLEAGNSVVTDGTPTAHAELNLVALAHHHGLAPDQLARATLYASTEPCPMCAGAIYWGGIGRVVFGLSQARLYEHIRRESGTDDGLLLSCAELVGRGSHPVEVLGPAAEDEAISVHVGFWAKN
jgi:tRNA(Arg) A34 adenosine deaminase TadA